MDESPSRTGKKPKKGNSVPAAAFQKRERKGFCLQWPPEVRMQERTAGNRNQNANGVRLQIPEKIRKKKPSKGNESTQYETIG